MVKYTALFFRMAEKDPECSLKMAGQNRQIFFQEFGTGFQNVYWKLAEHEFMVSKIFL
jgi:hypothetical protein